MNRRSTLVVVIACFAVTAFSAISLADGSVASDGLPAPGAAPVVSSPKPNAEVGPSVLVVGKAAKESLIVIYTQVYDLEDPTIKYRPIPGHRHYVNSNGGFSLLVATPRAFFSSKRQLRYEIHVYAVTPSGQQSPHTIIPVLPKQSSGD